MAKLVIHAGIHRTGTTALQRTLENSRSSMRNLGYCYPGENTNHQDWAWSIFRNEKSSRDLHNYLIEQSDGCHTIILSGEDFAIHRDLGWLKSISQDFDTHVYITLRRQDDWLMSWYNQHVRWPFDRRKSQMSPDEFLDTIDDYYWLNFDRLADLWASAVSRSNLHLCVMKSGHNEELLEEIAPDIQLTQLKKDNSSITPEALELLRRIELFDLNNNQRMKIIKSVNNLYPIKRGSNNNIFSTEVRKSIIKKFAEGNKYLGSKYFSSDCSPFSDIIPETYRGVSFDDQQAASLVVSSLPKLIRAIMNE